MVSMFSWQPVKVQNEFSKQELKLMSLAKSLLGSYKVKVQNALTFKQTAPKSRCRPAPGRRPAAVQWVRPQPPVGCRRGRRKGPWCLGCRALPGSELRHPLELGYEICFPAKLRVNRFLEGNNTNLGCFLRSPAKSSTFSDLIRKTH